MTNFSHSITINNNELDMSEVKSITIDNQEQAVYPIVKKHPNSVFLENSWRRLAGYEELEIDYEQLASEVVKYKEEQAIIAKEEAWKTQYGALKETEWSNEFEQLMRHRLIMGSFRYGPIAHTEEAKLIKPSYDRITSCIKRLQRYLETKNKEYLVDTANICLMEFVEGDGHFCSIDDDDVHAEIIAK